MYQHKVQYYETDKMGITHHSNYIRWMEEARVDYQANLGYPYERLEAEGIMSPVLGVQCDYKHSTTFGDVVDITVSVLEFTGLRLKIGYVMLDASGRVVATGETKHCFLNTSGRPVRLDRVLPEFYNLLKAELEKSAEAKAIDC